MTAAYLRASCLAAVGRAPLLVGSFLCASALGGVAPGTPALNKVFPLKVSENRRYLVDRQGKPFLYHADTPWMLSLKLTEPEAQEYITRRREQGFNALQVQLTGFLGMTNRAGDLPFAGRPPEQDFARPNERFFAHVDRVVGEANRQGMLLAIAPLWSGCCGEGWAGRETDGRLKPLNANGSGKCRELGRWLGQRYGKFSNVLWILGGDNDPNPAREELRQLGLGLKEAAPGQLITFHAASSHSSTDVWPANESWLDVSMVYTYFRGFNKAWNKNQPDVYEVSHAECAKTPVRPFFLGESTYEGEHDAWGSALQTRKQAWWCVLGGGMGHAYGSPNWNIPANWREVLELPGARSLNHLRALLESRPWWKLVPDTNNLFAVEGRGPFASNDYTVTAVAADGSFAMSYLPAPRALTVDLARLSGQTVSVKWFDPRTGRTTPVGDFAREGKREFTPPAGPGPDLDWVLVFDAVEDSGAASPASPREALPVQGARELRASIATNAVDVYDFVEITLRPDPPIGGNPFTDAVVDGEFGPVKGGATLKVDGFCDSQDGSVYRIRFMPSQPGDYRYQVTLRHGGPAQSHEGTFTARRAHRRGVLRVDPKHPLHFVWEGTGDHYFWNGTTTYYLMGWQNDETIRRIIDRLSDLKINRLRVLLYGRNEDRPWGQPVRSTDEFKLYLNPWVAQRPDNLKEPGFDLRRFNVDSWQRYERMLAYAKQKGMVVSVIPFIAAQVLVTPYASYSEEEQLYYRYAVARLSAFCNITWDLGNEHDLHREAPKWADWMGPLVKQWDPYDHLTAAHNRIYRSPGNPWNDMQLVQRWDPGGQRDFFIQQRKQQAASGRIVPLVNEEYGYEDLWDKKPGDRNADSRRRCAWEICMAGAYQTTGETANRGTGFPPDTGGGWVNGRGDDTMTLLRGNAHLLDFFSSFDWWRAEPRNDLVEGPAQCLAETGEVYAVYLPKSGRVKVTLGGSLSYRARWFNPRSGEWTKLPDASGPVWETPEPPGAGDWALLLTTYDWTTREWKSYFNHDGLQFNNNRWAGEEGSLRVRFGPPTASWWTTHSGNRPDFPVSAPWVGVGSDWGNISSNSPFPIKLSELEVLKASVSATVPRGKPNQMFKLYWQLYFSDQPDGKFNQGDFAPTVYGVNIPPNHWGTVRGSTVVDGRQWRFADQGFSSGMGRFIIPMLEPQLVPDANGVVEIRDVDMKVLIDWCITEGFYRAEDYCMVILAGWEVWVQDDILRVNDMAITIKQKGKPAVTIPAWTTLMGTRVSR